MERGASSVGAFGDVEHGPVEVDAGVAEAAGLVGEDGAEESGAGFGEGAGLASADRAGGRLEVALDLGPGGVECLLDVAGVVVAAECPDERHRLRRREGEVESGDLGAADGERVAAGVTAGEELGQFVAVGDAGEAVGGGQRSGPSAR